MSAHSWAWRAPCPLQAAPATPQQRGLGPGSAPPVPSHVGPAGWTGGGVCNRCRQRGAVARGGSVVHTQLFLGCRMWLRAPLQLPHCSRLLLSALPAAGWWVGWPSLLLQSGLREDWISGVRFTCRPSAGALLLARFPGGPCCSRKVGGSSSGGGNRYILHTKSSACDRTLTRWFCMYSLLSLYHKHRHRVLKSPQKWIAPL